MGFAKLIGHERPIRLVKAMLTAGRLPHALLITGPTGVGKRTLALGLAQTVNCTGSRADEPCDACLACGKISRGVHPDVAEIEPEGRLRIIKIESIRELRQQIAFRPYEGRMKVFIIREAERMQVQGDSAANALLKTLEEPPPESLLILTAPRDSDLLPTIVSRCLRLNLAPLPRETVEKWLDEKRGLSGPQARLMASMSEGCLGRVIDMDPDEVWNQRREVVDQLRSLDSRSLEEALEWVGKLAKAEALWPRIFSLIRYWYRDLMFLAGRIDDRRRLVNEDMVVELESAAAGRKPQSFIKALAEIDRAEEALNRLIRPDLVLENLVLALADL